MALDKTVNAEPWDCATATDVEGIVTLPSTPRLIVQEEGRRELRQRMRCWQRRQHRTREDPGRRQRQEEPGSDPKPCYQEDGTRDSTDKGGADGGGDPGTAGETVQH
ncbi:unnamed protein product [Leuciscus chuanchicus]